MCLLPKTKHSLILSCGAVLFGLEQRYGGKLRVREDGESMLIDVDWVCAGVV